MDFDFTDEQYSFRNTARDLLAGCLSAAELRRIWDEGADYDHRVWRRLGELGVPGLLVSEEFGGAGGSLVDLLLILEVTGAAAVPEPVVESAVAAPVLVERFGSEALRQRWLPRLATGEALVALAAHADEPVVPDGLTADAVIVLRDGAIHLVGRDGVSGRPLRGGDPSRRLAVCAFALDAPTLVTDDPAAVALLESLAATGTAAQLVGLAEYLVHTTRDYVLQRRQFDRAIGEFQAVKHRLADALVHVEAARSLTWNAGYRLAADDETAAIAAHSAKAAASLAAREANAAALQLHGGIGFTWEHDLHLWLQRGKALERAHGSTLEHRLRIGAKRLGVA